MAVAFFYHTTVGTTEKYLPGLLQGCLEEGGRVLLCLPDEERQDFIDAYLWTFTDSAFIPHGKTKTEFAQDQPILLSVVQVNENNASILFCMDGVALTQMALSYKKIVVLFDARDEQQLERAREQWQLLKNKGFKMHYKKF